MTRVMGQVDEVKDLVQESISELMATRENLEVRSRRRSRRVSRRISRRYLAGARGQDAHAPVGGGRILPQSSDAPTAYVVAQL